MQSHNTLISRLRNPTSPETQIFGKTKCTYRACLVQFRETLKSRISLDFSNFCRYFKTIFNDEQVGILLRYVGDT